VELRVSLRRADGTTAVLSVLSEGDNGKRHLFYSDKELPWSYQALFGWVKRPAATRPLSENAFESLRKVLSLKK
jgi:hypothetical protein